MFSCLKSVSIGREVSVFLDLVMLCLKVRRKVRWTNLNVCESNDTLQVFENGDGG